MVTMEEEKYFAHIIAEVEIRILNSFQEFLIKELARKPNCKIDEIKDAI